MAAHAPLSTTSAVDGASHVPSANAARPLDLDSLRIPTSCARPCPSIFLSPRRPRRLHRPAAFATLRAPQGSLGCLLNEARDSIALSPRQPFAPAQGLA